MKVYMVEVGVLLDETHKEFEFYKRDINDLYYGLYDENVCAFIHRDEAIDFLVEYVDKGIKNTYGIMWDIEREIESYEMEELINNHYLEDEYLSIDVKPQVFKVKGEKNHEHILFR